MPPPTVRLPADHPNWDDFLADLAQRWGTAVSLRKQDRSRRRQEDILQAALRVFARDGIARARIADVAAEAGMPVSSIYEYYNSKEELAYAVPLIKIGEFFVDYAQRAGKLRTVRERLRTYILLSTDFARRNPEWARTLYLEVWPSVLVTEARVRTALDEYASIIVELLRAGEEAGEWAGPLDRYEAATILVGSANQMIITWLMYRRPRDLKRAATSLVEKLLGALLPPPQPATPPAQARTNGAARRKPNVVRLKPAGSQPT